MVAVLLVLMSILILLQISSAEVSRNNGLRIKRQAYTQDNGYYYNDYYYSPSYPYSSSNYQFQSLYPSYNNYEYSSSHYSKFYEPYTFPYQRQSYVNSYTAAYLPAKESSRRDISPQSLKLTTDAVAWCRYYGIKELNCKSTLDFMDFLRRRPKKTAEVSYGSPEYYVAYDEDAREVDELMLEFYKKQLVRNYN